MPLLQQDGISHSDSSKDNKLCRNMPLLQQESVGRTGGTKENRRSLTEFHGLDQYLMEPFATAPRNNAQNPFSVEAWPRSPEAAASPPALEPFISFPADNAQDYASSSESAQLGSVWSNGNGIADIVSSLKSLRIPPARSSRNLQASIQLRLDYQQTDDVKPRWPPDTLHEYSKDDHAAAPEKKLARRASFYGSTSAWCGRGPARWSGRLPARSGGAGALSSKLFLGGLPWDVTEQALFEALQPYGPTNVEWPGRECGTASPRGYAYVTFESERSVRALLAASRRDHDDWYYRITGRKLRTKEVQVIPWAVSDSVWVRAGSARLAGARTVFVGALHGMLSAHALATIMNQLFDGVIYAGIDTDKNKYPIGSGRVTFNNARSYLRAISAAYVEIRTDKFTKKIQVDPYLEDAMCSACNLHQGPYFCRDPLCFKYYCRSCWNWHHTDAQMESHKPLMRLSKSNATGSSQNAMSPPKQKSSHKSSSRNANSPNSNTQNCYSQNSNSYTSDLFSSQHSYNSDNSNCLNGYGHNGYSYNGLCKQSNIPPSTPDGYYSGSFFSSDDFASTPSPSTGIGSGNSISSGNGIGSGNRVGSGNSVGSGNGIGSGNCISSSEGVGEGVQWAPRN